MHRIECLCYFRTPPDTTAPPGDATNTPTNIQLRRDPYSNGAKDGSSIYDVYYGGFRTMMPWLKGRE